MSKKIDVTDVKNLSDDDLQYLYERGQLPAGVDFPKSAPAPPPAPTAAPMVTPPSAPEEPATAGETLEDMSVSQLKKEAGKRDLSKGGSKQDLIDRIREHDDADDVIAEES